MTIASRVQETKTFKSAFVAILKAGVDDELAV